MTIGCPIEGDLVRQRLERVLTQYRESPNLLGLIKTYLDSAEIVLFNYCSLPDFFDINTAVGDQLTLIGKRLGWPRCHCICDSNPVFGFDCNVSTSQYILGFCEGSVSWINCDSAGYGLVCIEDDDIYRKFLKVRVYQILRMFDLASIKECADIFFGPTASILDHGFGRIVLAPGRNLTSLEIALLQLYGRVFPSVIGVELKFHFGTNAVFGFGDGWFGFCENLYQSELALVMSDGAILVDNLGRYLMADGYGLDIITDDGDNLITDDGDNLVTDVIYLSGDWMCEFYVNPYNC